MSVRAVRFSASGRTDAAGKNSYTDYILIFRILLVKFFIVLWQIRFITFFSHFRHFSSILQRICNFFVNPSYFFSLSHKFTAQFLSFLTKSASRYTKALPHSVCERALFAQYTVFQRFSRSLAAVNVLAISIARVIGPTPPGTGVICDAFSATAA